MKRLLFVALVLLTSRIALPPAPCLAEAEIALHVKLHGALRDDFVPRGGTVEAVEAELSTYVIKQIMDANRWEPFVWRLIPFDSRLTRPPQGMIRISLFELDGDDNYPMQVLIGPYTPSATEKFELDQFDDRFLFDVTGVRAGAPPLTEEELKASIARRFAAMCLHEEKIHEFDRRLRLKIIAGHGVVKQTSGALPISSEKSDRFRRAKFRWDWELQKDLPLTSTGVCIKPDFLMQDGKTSTCVIMEHVNAPAMLPRQLVPVFLESSIKDLRGSGPPTLPSKCQELSSQY